MNREDDLLKYYTVPPDEYLAYLPAAYEAISPEERKSRITELNQRVKDNVARIQNSSEFRNFLIAMSRFHTYSWNNQMLIWLQKPIATHVAGFNTWKDLGRYVKRGETGIAVLAPLGPTAGVTWTRATDGAVFEIRKTGKGWGIYDSNGRLMADFKARAEAVRQLTAWGCVARRHILDVNNFKIVHIFDISQTEGKPLPEFDVPVLTGEANQDLFDQLLRLAKEQNVDVSFESRPHQDPAIKGVYTRPNRIWVRPEEAPAQQLKTLLHELGHHYSESVFRIPRADAETIAESAAYIVGAHYSFDTGVRSFPYVAVWARDEKTLNANMKAVQEVAEKIIDTLEKRPARLMPQTRGRAASINEMERSYSLEQVKAMAKDQGLSTSGSKRDIIIRLGV